MGYSPWGGKESDTIERLNTHAQEGRGAACVVFQTGPQAYGFSKPWALSPVKHR